MKKQRQQQLHCPKCNKRQAAEFSDVLAEFCEKTSTRGLPRAVREQSRIWAALWYSSVLMLLLFAAWQIALLCRQYISYEVTQQETTTRELKIDFPSITVCNLNPIGAAAANSVVKDVPSHLQSLKAFYAHLDTLEAKYPSMKSHLQQLRSTEGFYHNIPKALHHKYGHSVFDLVNSCTIRVATGYSSSISRNCSTIRITQSPLFYNCFTVKVDERDAKLAKSLTLILYLDDSVSLVKPEAETSDVFGHSLGVNVFIHESNSYPDIGRSSTRLGPGVSGRIDLTPRMWRQLGGQYSKCADDQVSNSARLENAGVLLQYSRAGCLTACLQRRLAADCGCVEPAWPLSSSLAAAMPYCMNASLTMLDLRRRLDCRSTVQRHETECSEKCPYKCKRVQFPQKMTSSAWPLPANQLAFYEKYIASQTYSSKFKEYSSMLKLAASGESREKLYQRLTATDLISRSFLQVSVHRDFELRVIDEHPAYGLNQLLSGIGGIFSLTIGITMITVIELIELFYRAVLFAFCRQKWRRVSSRAAAELCDCDE